MAFTAPRRDVAIAMPDGALGGVPCVLPRQHMGGDLYAGLPRGAGAGRSSPESETTLRGHGYTSEDGATALTEVLSNAAAQINKPFAVLPCDQSEQRAETALACAR